MRLAILLAAAFSFLAYAQAIRVLFGRPDGVQPGMRLISLSGTIAALFDLGWLSLGPLASFSLQLLALSLYAFGFALFSWAWVTTRARPLNLAFSRSPSNYVLAKGPYHVVRHPFYTSYTLTWMAGCVATASWIAIGLTLWMVVLYALAARREEALFLAGPMSSEYRRYSSKVRGFPIPLGSRRVQVAGSSSGDHGRARDDANRAHMSAASPRP